MKSKFILVTLMLLASEATSLPLQDTEKSPNRISEKCSNCKLSAAKYRELLQRKRESKKDLFMSRGWGAGGMPFSVLYMNPHSSKMPHLAENSIRAMPVISQHEQYRSQPQVRTSMSSKSKHKNTGSIPRSVIPQLFVSYGWGPLGKK